MKTKIMEALKKLLEQCDLCGRSESAHKGTKDHVFHPKRPSYQNIMKATGLSYYQVANHLHIMRMESGAKTTKELCRL